MKQEIKVPSMGESITEAKIGVILKLSGSTVEADDEILELETDKVNQVLYAPQKGVLTLLVQPEETVKIGQVIGSVDIAAKGEAKAKIETPAPQATVQPSVKEAPQQKSNGARQTKEQYIAELNAPRQPEKPEKTQEPKEKGASAPFIPPSDGSLRETRRKMTTVRKVIAKRLVEAKQTTAMLTTFNEVDMSQVIAARTKYKESFAQEHQGIRLGFMSFFVKAVVAALKAYPSLNSYIDGDEWVQREYYNIGIAVGTDRGLFVPVLRHCDRLSFAEIEGQLAELAEKGRKGTLVVDDLQGGGFTITNGGVYGSLLSTPILNPPQSGILGMHTIQKRPVAIDDQVVIRPMMYLALSYDHRIVDGKEAVSFLVHIKHSLEDLSTLLLKI